LLSLLDSGRVTRVWWLSGVGLEAWHIVSADLHVLVHKECKGIIGCQHALPRVSSHSPKGWCLECSQLEEGRSNWSPHICGFGKGSQGLSIRGIQVS
jgi:hypothetical protein